LDPRIASLDGSVSLFVHLLVELFHTNKESIAAINSLMLSSKPKTRDFIGINWAAMVVTKDSKFESVPENSL
jgi:hypothetical protein